MAITSAPAYLTTAELKATLAITGSSFDDDLDRALLAASRAIDSATGRRFWADEDATSVRYYTPGCASSLEIDDAVTVAAVAVDRDGNGSYEEPWTVGTQYRLGPPNADVDFLPWTRLEVISAGGETFYGGSAWAYGGTSYYLPAYQRSVKVTGKFGWAAVPPGIETATGIIASKLFKRVREAPWAIVFAHGMDSAVAIRLARTDPDVAPLLNDYTRRKLLV